MYCKCVHRCSWSQDFAQTGLTMNLFYSSHFWQTHLLEITPTKVLFHLSKIDSRCCFGLCWLSDQFCHTKGTEPYFIWLITPVFTCDFMSISLLRRRWIGCLFKHCFCNTMLWQIQKRVRNLVAMHWKLHTLFLYVNDSQSVGRSPWWNVKVLQMGCKK